MAKVVFILSFPNTPTWNGKSSLNERYYAISRNVPTKRRDEILKKRFYSYRWSDGWSALIRCETLQNAKKELKFSQGFCGYGWMVDSIIEADAIMTHKELYELEGAE